MTHSIGGKLDYARVKQGGSQTETLPPRQTSGRADQPDSRIRTNRHPREKPLRRHGSQ